MTEPHRYKIVIAVDFSEMSETVVETALDLAARHEAPELHLLSVLPTSSGFLRRDTADHDSELDDLSTRLRTLAGEKLADFGHPFDDLKGWRVSTHTRAGDPAEHIADLAWEAEADLILVGRHSDTSRRRLFVGSVPQRVMQLARCPVLIAQPTDYNVDHSADTSTAEQCPDCVAIRGDSGGSRWFCEAHSDIRLTRSMFMAHHAITKPDLGGPLL